VSERISRFVVLEICPTITPKGEHELTTRDVNEVLGAALRQVGNHTTSLRDLQRALDDGAQVYLLRVAANGKPIMQIQLYP